MGIEKLFVRLGSVAGDFILNEVSAYVVSAAMTRPTASETSEAVAYVGLELFLEKHRSDLEGLFGKSFEDLEVFALIKAWAIHVAEFMVKNVPAEDERRSSAFHRGNYASAYETEKCVVPDGFDSIEREAYLDGFFSSFEIYEVPEEFRDEVAKIRMSRS